MKYEIELKHISNLYKELNKNQDLLQSLNEPEHIMQQRIALTKQIKVMRDAQKVIRRDPE